MVATKVHTSATDQPLAVAQDYTPGLLSKMQEMLSERDKTTGILVVEDEQDRSSLERTLLAISEARLIVSQHSGVLGDYPGGNELMELFERL